LEEVVEKYDEGVESGDEKEEEEAEEHQGVKVLPNLFL
jgi:hypothetical protein